jgi:hypothetical protein
MPEPEMFPLVENPHYTDYFETFDELRDNAENMLGVLNFPLSWWIYDQHSEYWDSEEDPTPNFELCVVMPRKSSFTIWNTNVFNRNVVEEWLNTFVKQNVMEWYGWQS